MFIPNLIGVNLMDRTERIITMAIALLTFGTLAYMVVYIALYGVFTGTNGGII